MIYKNELAPNSPYTMVWDDSSAENVPSSENLVPKEIVEECLCLYPNNQKHLETFVYCTGQLTATLLPHDIEYSTIIVDYYTASQFVLTASQMSYVLAGCVFFDPLIPVLPECLYPTYLDYLRAGRLYYTDLILRLRKMTSNRIPQKVTMRVMSIIHRRGLYLMTSRLFLPDRNGYIDVSTVMSTGGETL